MRGSLETIVGAMFAGKTSELLKRILWANHQNKKIVVIKPSLDDRYCPCSNTLCTLVILPAPDSMTYIL